MIDKEKIKGLLGSFTGKQRELPYAEDEEGEERPVERQPARREPSLYPSAPDPDEGPAQEELLWQRLGGQGLLRILRIVAGAALLAAALLTPEGPKWLNLLPLLSLLVSGYDILGQAFTEVLNKKHVGEYQLLCVAAVAPIFIGRGWAGAALMLVFQLYTTLRRYLLDKAAATLDAMLELYPEPATLAEGEEEIYPADIRSGDELLLRVGECAAVDCVVTEGSSTIDTCPLTGTERRVKATPGSRICGGSLNCGDTLRVQATRDQAGSTPETLRRLSQDDSQGMGSAEILIRRVERLYAPFALGVCIVAALLLILLAKADVSAAIERALILLVVTSPGALLLSVPLTYAAGLKGTLHRGVLVRGPVVLDDLVRAGTVIFDKDRTLTTGKYRVAAIQSEHLDSNMLLKVAAHAGAASRDPLAMSIRNAYEGVLDPSLLQNVVDIPGEGLEAQVGDLQLLMGSYDFLTARGIELEAPSGDEGISVFLALQGRYAGRIVLTDILRSNAAATVLDLDAEGCGTVILTGDSEKRARAAAEALSASEYYGRCLPMDKLAYIREIRERHRDGAVLYVGDGVNDTAALEAAELGVVLDGLSGETPLDTGRVTILDDAPEKLACAIADAKHTQKAAMLLLLASTGVKIVLFLLALAGLVDQLWFAAVVDGALGLGGMLIAMQAFKGAGMIR